MIAESGACRHRGEADAGRVWDSLAVPILPEVFSLSRRLYGPGT